MMVQHHDVMMPYIISKILFPVVTYVVTSHVLVGDPTLTLSQ